jgi:uncharacterized OB-fold protein
MASATDTGDALVAPHSIEYTYTRSTGPAIGAFLGALGERRILGSRGSDGRVLVPPSDYDPVTSAELGDLVAVGSAGVVTTWAWNDDPQPGQPLDRPFAWALIRLDGADTALLHAVDAGSPDRVRTGARVRAVWADRPTGTIHDLACFTIDETAS